MALLRSALGDDLNRCAAQKNPAQASKLVFQAVWREDGVARETGRWQVPSQEACGDSRCVTAPSPRLPLGGADRAQRPAARRFGKSDDPSGTP